MSSLWRFMQNRSNREVLTWLGGGLVILVTGAWALFTYVYPSPPAERPLDIRAECSAVNTGTIDGATVSVHCDDERAAD